MEGPEHLSLGRVSQWRCHTYSEPLQDGCVKLPDSLAPAFPSKSTWYHTQSKSVTWNTYCSTHRSFLFLSPSLVRWSICRALVHGLWTEAFRWGGVCSSDVLGNRLLPPRVPEGTHGAELCAHLQTCTGCAVQAGNLLFIWEASLLPPCILFSPVTQKKSQLGPPNWGGRRIVARSPSSQLRVAVFFFNKYFMNLNLANIGIFFLI